MSNIQIDIMATKISNKVRDILSDQGKLINVFTECDIYKAVAEILTDHIQVKHD